ncbi:9314_t:CDS:2, partial [Racocetra persica]
AMMKDFLESLTETKIDSNDVNNENNKIKEYEMGGEEKQEDAIRKVIVNKRRNEETCGVKNKNIENILMKGNETAQKVKPNLVSVKVSSDESAVEFERDDLRKCRKTMNNMAVMNCHVKRLMWLSNLSQKPNDGENRSMISV